MLGVSKRKTGKGMPPDKQREAEILEADQERGEEPHWRDTLFPFAEIKHKLLRMVSRGQKPLFWMNVALDTQRDFMERGRDTDMLAVLSENIDFRTIGLGGKGALMASELEQGDQRAKAESMDIMPVK